MQVYDVLVEAVAAMQHEPFGRQDLLGWAADHYPEVDRGDLSTHLQLATSNSTPEVRALQDGLPPLVTRVGRGQFVRHVEGSRRAGVSTPPSAPVQARGHHADPGRHSAPEPTRETDDAPPPRLMVATTTIWGNLEQCVDLLRRPFSTEEVLAWFRLHRPEVDEPSLRAHIHGATANATDAERGIFADRTPLITRIGADVFTRFDAAMDDTAPSIPEPATGLAGEQLVREQLTGEQRATHDVHATIADRLSAIGWRIAPAASTSGEADVNLIAEQGGQTLAVTIADYPPYAGPRRGGGQRRGQPQASAETLFAAALLAAMRIRSREPGWVCAIGLPAITRYRRLFAETRSALSQCEIHLLWVDETGRLHEEMPVAAEETPDFAGDPLG